MMESLLHNVYNDIELGEYFSEGPAVSYASTSHRDTTHDLHTPPLPIAAGKIYYTECLESVYMNNHITLQFNAALGDQL
jgi:hypothetical protein